MEAAGLEDQLLPGRRSMIVVQPAVTGSPGLPDVSLVLPKTTFPFGFSGFPVLPTAGSLGGAGREELETEQQWKDIRFSMETIIYPSH